MNYISQIFERANMQQICGFLLYGSESGEAGQKSCKQRIDEACTDVLDMLQKKIPDGKERESVINEIYAYASVAEEVHMEIGLQCGMLLAMQLFSSKE